MKTYWTAWAVLLGITLTMVWADGATIPRMAYLLVMVGAMLLKASIIGGNFMHLRSERLPLVLTVVVGLLVTATVLFALIAPDAMRIHDMTSAR
jgi:cytochrome c oxidase subunit IV